MKLKLIAIAKPGPNWVETGFVEYSKRLPRHLNFQLILIDPNQKDPESKMLSAADGNLIALDASGQLLNNEMLSTNLNQWQQFGSNVNLLIGGAEGFSKKILDLADDTWSLGRITLPHAMVRIILAEQLYRAHTMLTNHPYHK